MWKFILTIAGIIWIYTVVTGDYSLTSKAQNKTSNILHTTSGMMDHVADKVEGHAKKFKEETIK